MSNDAGGCTFQMMPVQDEVTDVLDDPGEALTFETETGLD